MNFENIKSVIERVFDKNEDVNPGTSGEVRDAIETALNYLDRGELRVAEPLGNSQWQVNQWLKKAVLLSFKLNDMDVISGGPESPNKGPANWWDKTYDESIDPAYWPYSIEINVKADEDGVIASHSGPKSGYKIFVQDGRPGIAVLCRTWIATRTTIDAPDSILGKWTQLKAVIDYNRLIFSVDGEVVDSVPLPQPFKYATGRPLIIGAGGAQVVNQKVPHNPLVGAVKEVVIKREL